MNMLPKNSLPKAKTFGSIVFRARFEMMLSALQNNVAIRTNAVPILNSNDVSLRSRKFPISNSAAGIIIFLLNFSFRKITARIATKMNIVLWMNAPMEPLLNCNPLKNSTNGIDPPTNPIVNSWSHSFLFSFLRLFSSLNPKIIPSKNNATMLFFRNVNTVESIPFTPNLFTNIEQPDMSAVKNMNVMPLFFMGKLNFKLFIKFVVLMAIEMFKNVCLS